MAYHSFQGVGCLGGTGHPTPSQLNLQQNKNFCCIFQNIIVIYQIERMFHKPGERAVAMIINKEDIERLLETLTEEQLEYIYYLIKGLFCQAAN